MTPGSPSLALSRLIVALTVVVNGSAYSSQTRSSSSSAGTVGGGSGSFSVTGNHSYVAGGTYPITVTITAIGTNQGGSTVSDASWRLHVARKMTDCESHAPLPATLRQSPNHFQSGRINERDALALEDRMRDLP